MKLAAWCAEELKNAPAQGSGLLAALNERRGPVGTRVRLYVELAKVAGCRARLFSIYTPGARHTAAHVLVGNKEVFVDPIWGCVCRMDGRLASFDEMHRDPEKAERHIEYLTIKSTGIAGGDPPERQRAQRIKRLYNARQLAVTRSFGFLNDTEPHPFHMTFDLSRLWYFPKCTARDATRTHFIESTEQFGIAIPSFLGETDRRPAHYWEFTNASLHDEYELAYALLPVKGPVTLTATSDTVEFLTEPRIAIQDTGAQGELPIPWVLRFRPRSRNPSLSVVPAVQKSGSYTTISELELRRVGGPLLNRTPHTNGITDAILACAGRLPTDESRRIPPPSPDRIAVHLRQHSPIAILLHRKEFHPWRQRPYNFTWISEALAALYAHRATGDLSFLDWIIHTFDQLLAFRDSETGKPDEFRNRIMSSWGSYITLHMHGGRKAWVNEVCTAACMVMPVLLFCCEMRRAPVSAEKYHSAAARYLPVCKRIVEEYLEEIRVDPRTGGAYLIMPHDGEPEPTAHAAPYAAALLALHICTGEPGYLRLAEQFAAYFRASISADENAVWSWPYRPVPEQMTGSGAFYFKARVALIFPMIANSLGFLFSDEDMKKFSETFTTNVLTADGTVYMTISSNDRTVLDEHQLLHYAHKRMAPSLLQIVGYYPLTLFDPRVGARIEDFVARNPLLYPNDYFTLPLGVEAYAARLAPSKALRPSQGRRVSA